MKLNFRKITAIATSALMVGMTMGSAIALAPSDKAFNAVVYGVAADASDKTQADIISTWLELKASSTGGTLSGEGDKYKLEKSSTKFHLGDTVSTVVSVNLDDDELPTLLAEGTYVDDDNADFDFEQKVTLASATQLVMFSNDDYKVDSPTLGFEITDGSSILNYTLDFRETPFWSDLVTTDLTLMGKSYYVLSTTANNSITLLDSANTVLLSEGETQTVGGKTVSIEFIGSAPEVKLNIDGYITNNLAEGETEKLPDGSYVGIKDISYNAKDTGISQVEFSLGSGKLVLAHGSEVELNEEDVDNLNVFITNASTATMLDKITIEWKADDDLFIAPDAEITMPGFEALKMSFTGMTYPVEESIVVEASGDDNIVLSDFPIKDTTEDINILFSNTTNFTIVGKDSNNKLATAGPGQTLTFTQGTHDYFALTYISGDDAESYLVRAINFDDSEYPDNTVDFEYLVSGAWKDADSIVNASESVTIGSAEFTVNAVSNESAKTVNLTVTGNNNFYQLYSKEGMQVILPWMNQTALNITNITQYSSTNACAIARQVATSIGQLGHEDKVVYYNNTNGATIQNTTTCDYHPATYILNFREEDKDGNLASEDWINVTLGIDTDSKAYISTYATSNTDATATEIGETDVLRDFTYSNVTTEILFDQSDSPDKKITLNYHGEESYGDVYITSAGISAITTTGNMVFTDAEKTSWQGYNVILVGGSCINTATATVLHGSASPVCTEAWTAATGVGDGKYLIQAIGDKFTIGKTALVVAGYTKDNTVAASTKLRTAGASINTTAGNKYVGIVGVGLDSTISKI